MTTTHAIVASGPGGPEVLELREVPLAAPGSGEVTISVRAAGINPVDLKKLAGAEAGARPGIELSGVVTAVGDGAVGPLGEIAVGDEVVAYPVVGGYAQDVTVPATSVLRKPRALDWARAANLLLVGVTATHLLEATGVHDGDTVLVHGASGGVGLTALQLALQRGATVVGTASAANQQLVADHGGIPVIYGEGLADRVRSAAPEGIDVALDTVGTDEAVDVSLELVADRDRIATIAAFARGGEAGIRLLGGGPGADPGREIRSAARGPLVELADRGALDVVVGRTFPLAEARAALELVASGHPGGQVALLP
ncbi:quinone oxidoreductase family protein [Salinibacterium soli]|uniref:NADP-dependent oxidoreductase n=1 Tax=Antiquaquibacter soli TaxID=3064523 RepID=A0ABT9BUY6_9MICO|nr:NADP-dependent oxidoreductase [Protaetiibacter sp. WY-16]MDO7883601.1 NADP-dependent oxidoreductase [Protaetiibacter sp. WY-16]